MTDDDVVLTLRVRYGECDPQGVIFNANYLLYLDMAFAEWCRDRFAGGYAGLLERGFDAMLVQSNLAFRRPGRADEVLEVTFAPAAIGRTSTTFTAAVRRDGVPLLEAELVYVWVDPATLRKIDVPPEVRAAAELAAARNPG